MLTFVRTNEMMKAEWSEFDFSKATWRIPAARMKMRREHIVPLSRQAIAILIELNELNGHRRHVFASPVNPKKPMAKDVALKELKRIGYGTIMSGHGFRTMAMGVIKEMLGYNHDPVDRQLAHLPKNSVDRAYDRSSFMRQRIPMMQAYADCLDAINNHEITDEQGVYNDHTIDTTETPTTLTIPKIINTEEVLRVLKISRPTLYRGIKSGHYPKPFKRSLKLNGWYANEIAECVQSRFTIEKESRF